MNSNSFALPDQEIAAPFNRSRLWRAAIVWGLATFFYFYDNLLQVSPSAMKPELSLAFASTAEQFGSLSAYCLYAYGIMQIPAGLLMDRFGPRRLLTFACICCALGSLMFGIATTLGEAKFGRVMIGVGAAFALIGCLKIAHHWFPANRFALMTGLSATVGFLGAVFGLSTVSKVIEILGWRASMQWGGVAGLLLSVLLWVIIKNDKPNGHGHVLSPHAKTVNSRELLAGFGEILKHKQTWCAALYAGLMYVPTLAFGGLWGIPFLQEAHGFDRATAGVSISLIYVGWACGAPFWGFISDYYRRRNTPMMVATLATLAICLALLYIHPLSLGTLNVLLFTLGFFSSSFILAFAVVRESTRPQNAATAIGFTNAINTFGGAIAQPIIGKILDMNATANGVGEATVERVFNLSQYQHALISLPIALAMSFCLLLFLKETYCQGRK